MDRKKTNREIASFINRVKQKYSPEKIILFGSRASSNYWKRSDYDFIIISNKFKNLHWLKRISRVVKLWDLSIDIDVLPYTPEEFAVKKKESSTLREAVKHGVLV